MSRFTLSAVALTCLLSPIVALAGNSGACNYKGKKLALVDGVARRVSLPTLLRSYLRRLTDRGARPAALMDELASLASRLGDARRTRLPA